MTTREFEDARKRELQAILDLIRYECLDLVDDYFIAFCASGRAKDEWNVVAGYEHLLFKALDLEKFTFEEKRGALKLIRAYLRNVIETLTIEGMYQAEARHETLRKS